MGVGVGTGRCSWIQGFPVEIIIDHNTHTGAGEKHLPLSLHIVLYKQPGK